MLAVGEGSVGEVKVREMSWKEAGRAKKRRYGCYNIDNRVCFCFFPKEPLKTILSWLCFWQSKLSRDCANCANTRSACVSENRLHIWFKEGVRLILPLLIFSHIFCIDIMIVLWRETQQSHEREREWERERRKKTGHSITGYFHCNNYKRKQHYNHWDIWRSFVKANLLFFFISW